MPKTLLLIVLMSVLTVGAFATSDSITVNYLGTDTENLVDSVPTFTIGDQIVIRGEFSNPSAVTSVSIDLLDDNWWTAPNTDSAYTIPADGELDIAYTLPAEAPLSFYPDSSTNTQVRLRVVVSYPDGDAYSFHRINTYPVDGVYPEIEEPEPDDFPEVADVMQAQLTIITEDTSYAQNPMTGWTVISPNARPGDILHFTGTYETSLGDTAFAQELSMQIHYHNADWSNGPFLYHEVPASLAKRNMDGIIDFKMKVPYFTPDSLLAGNDAYTAGSMWPVIHLRIAYSGDPVLKDFNGTKATNNTYYNWWGPLGTYEGEKPAACSDVTGFQASALTDSSVALTWDMANDAVWQIAMAETGTVRNADNAPVKLMTKALPTVVAGLEPGIEYDVWVRPVCNPDTLAFITGDYMLMEGTVATSVGTSVDKFEIEDEVNVYPNPTTGRLTIRTTETYDIEIRDLSGHVIMQTNTNVLGSKELDLTHISSGIYFIRFSNGHITFARKFIKQ